MAITTPEAQQGASGSAVTSLVTGTFATSPSVGDAVVVFVVTESTTSTHSAPTDSAGHTATQIGSSQKDTTNGEGLSAWIFENLTTGTGLTSYKVTGHWTSSSGTLIAIRVAGQKTPTSYNGDIVQNSLTNETTGANPSVGPTTVAPAANSLFFCAIGSDNVSTGSPYSNGTNIAWTSITNEKQTNNTSLDDAWVEHFIATGGSVAKQTGQWGNSSSVRWFGMVFSLAPSTGGGTAFTQTLTESVTWSDVLTRLTGKTLTDTWTPGDVLVRQTGKPLSESVTLSDVLTTTKVFLRTLAEVFTFSDTLTRSTGKVLSDASTLSDVLGRFIGKTLSDLWTPSDTLVKQTQKPLNESVTFSDVLSTVKVFLRTLTESLTWSDTLARRTSKSLAETATLSDVLSTASRYFRTLTETLTFSDVFSTLAQGILAAAKACETFFLGRDRGVGVPTDPISFAVGHDGSLGGVGREATINKPGADSRLLVIADITTFTDVGC